MYRKHELLEAKMCKELDLLEEKYRTGAEMSEGDLRRIDLLSHAIKSLAAYGAMKEAEEARYGQMGGSGASYNNSYGNNSYMNSGMNNNMGSYAQGQRENGMSHYMSRDNYPANSGYMPYYPEDRRW